MTADDRRVAVDDVQRIVLRGLPGRGRGAWRHSQQILIAFGSDPSAAPWHFLNLLMHDRLCGGSYWPHRAAEQEPPLVQVSLGLTRRGLERLEVPAHVMRCLALKAPAFWQGPALRAARHLGMTGANAPERWLAAFETDTLHAVLSLHANDQAQLQAAGQHIQDMACRSGLNCTLLIRAQALEPNRTQPGQRVHFGYLDGLSRVGIQGWTQGSSNRPLPREMHAAGEFVLGHPQNSGADRWVAGPGQRVWPKEVRDFFRNASFGVLQQIEQRARAFEDFVQTASRSTCLSADQIKAKLCGRTVDGQALAAPPGADITAEFDYATDRKGTACPLGSHIRRMNPREHAGLSGAGTAQRAVHRGGLAHDSQPRPLLRRGMPYGKALEAGEDDGCEEPDAPPQPRRGLMAQFFCANLEDQYEHLLGEWAERVPLGSGHRRQARDPLIGAHAPLDGAFEIPQPGALPPLRLTGLQAFTRTMGVAYLFYPSVSTLRGIAARRRWTPDDARDEGSDGACPGDAKR